MKGDLSRVALHGMFWMMSAAWAQAVARLLVFVVLARLLTPTQFGTVAAAMVVIRSAEIFTWLGIAPALVQRSDLTEKHIETGFTSSILVGIISAALLWALAPAIAQFFRIPELVPILRALVAIFPLQSLGMVSSALMSRDLQFRLISVVDVSAYVISHGCIGVLLALRGSGAWALVIATIANAAAKTALLVMLKRHTHRIGFDRSAFQDLAYFGGGLTLSRLFNHIASQADYFIVGRWLGPAALGYYERAYHLMTAAIAPIGGTLDRVLFPTLARAQQQRDALARAYRRLASSLVVCILPLSIVLWVLAPEVVHVMLGNSWEGLVVPFRILTLGMLFRVGYKVGGNVARATGAVYGLAARQAIYSVLVVCGSMVGQRWGIAGVASGVLMALAIHYVSMAQLGLRVIGLPLVSYGRMHFDAMRLAVLWGVTAAFVASASRSMGWTPYAIIGVTGGAVVCITLLFFWRAPGMAFGRDGVWLINQLLGTLPGGLRIAIALRAHIDRSSEASAA